MGRRLRSANRGNSNNVWYVNSSGNVNNNNAINSYRCAPDCVGKGMNSNSIRVVCLSIDTRSRNPCLLTKQHCTDASICRLTYVRYIRHGIKMEFENEILESAIGFDALYTSMCKCKKGVGWKDSVASYCLNGIENTLKLERQLKDGSYTPRSTKKIHITHPKPREAVSIAFRDRVYQRSLNDVAIYPAMSEQFVNSNCACQKGKGTDYAMGLLDKYLHEFYHKYRREGYVLQCDIKSYYQSIPHQVAEANFQQRLTPEIYKRAETVLRGQYEGEKGYNPGSQMVQIAGISVLSPLDHYIKEQLRIKWYMRYMDDFVLIHPSKDYLAECQQRIADFLIDYELVLHPDKTRIYPVGRGIKVLGFTHRLTETGKVVRIIDPDNVKAERKKLYRMAQLVKRGKMSEQKMYECYQSWRAHAKRGNSYKLLQRMDKYYKDLQKGDYHGLSKKDTEYTAEQAGGSPAGAGRQAGGAAGVCSRDGRRRAAGK